MQAIPPTNMMLILQRYRWLRLLAFLNLTKLAILFLTLGSVTPFMLGCRFLDPMVSSSTTHLYGCQNTPSLTFSHSDSPASRRRWLQTSISSVSHATPLLVPQDPAAASEPATNELPSFLRDYAKLGPLGSKKVFENKTTGLSLMDLARRLTNDLERGAHGTGGYFLTGDLSTDIFRDDCVFEDPTNRVASLSQYQKALSVLFDPDRSSIEIVDPLVVNDEEGTISGRLRSRGYLRLPWNPYISTYETTIRYTIDPETGLIARQDQSWSKSSSQALRESFTPSWVEPPPKSHRMVPSDEPIAITNLFNRLNGRRPSEFSAQERAEIDKLIEEIVESQKKSPPGASATVTNSLSGTWILAYLQPGPDGAGIDRRIPFPDFAFNDNYQVFSLEGGNQGGSVTNIGQLLGPLINVQVAGSLQKSTPSIPFQRYEANIEGGKMCFASHEPTVHCWIDLPMIQGQGLFDSLYLGDRLRIGQNLNGGGARVVQLRL